MIVLAARLVFMLTLVALTGSIAFLLVDDRNVPSLPDPRLKGERVRAQLVDLPPIQDFAYYYGPEDADWRDVNPFVPKDLRKQEIDRMKQGDRPVRIAQPPPAPNTRDVTPDIDLPEEPAYPELAQHQRFQGPQVLGRIDYRDRIHLTIRYDEEIWQISPGEAIGEWTLTGVEDGEALFADAYGEVWRVGIGRAGRPVNTADVAATAGPAARAPSQEEGPEEAPSAPQGRGRDKPAKTADELIGELMRNRGDKEKVRAILDDQEAMRTLRSDPRVKAMMDNPMFKQLIEQYR